MKQRARPSPPLRRHREGLTLVEIMVVIAILGVLMAVLGGGMLNAVEDANVQTTRLTIGRAQQALEMYAARHRGRFPSSSEGLSAATTFLPDGEVPRDAWGNAFQYLRPASNGDAPYEIISYGRDGEPGGEGFDRDLSSAQDASN